MATEWVLGGLTVTYPVGSSGGRSDPMAGDRRREELRRQASRRAAEREGQRVQRILGDQLRRSYLESIDAGARARELTDQIELRRAGEAAERAAEKAAAQAAEAAEILHGMRSRKATLREEIRAGAFARRRAWCDRLDAIEPADGTAETELTALRDELALDQALWSDIGAGGPRLSGASGLSTLPGTSAAPPRPGDPRGWALPGWTGVQPESPESRTGDPVPRTTRWPGADAAELMLQGKEEARRRHARALADSLSRLVSSLDLLIADRQRYRALTGT